MTKVCFIFLALLIATVAMADNQLKLKAMNEAEAPRVTKELANDVAIPSDSKSILSLTDPTPEFKYRSYDWLLGVKVQNFQPSGELQGYNTAPYRLENVSAFYLPSLEFGLRFKASSQWHWGSLSHVGYSSQQSLVSFTDKTQDPQARLTTILSDVGLMLDYEPLPESWGFQTSFGIGVINYSQAGSSAYTKVSRDSTFEFFSVGAHIDASQKWQVLLSYVNRNLLKAQPSGIFLPTDSAELGTRFIW